jgi:hypothetical protein
VIDSDLPTGHLSLDPTGHVSLCGTRLYGFEAFGPFEECSVCLALGATILENRRKRGMTPAEVIQLRPAAMRSF